MRQNPPFSRPVPVIVWRTAVVFAFLFVAACARKDVPAQAAAVVYDQGLTSTARVLAGMPTDFPAHAHFTALDAWKRHGSTVGKDWARLSSYRDTVIDRWRATNLSPAPRTCTKLLYPFAGPDFLNVYIFFPDCASYVLFGLELPGAVPNIDGMNDQQAAALLNDMHVALDDLFKRNYFITSRMMNQLSTPNLKGVLPLITTSMALLDIRIVSIEPYELPANGSAAPAPGRAAKGADSLASRPDSEMAQADSIASKADSVARHADSVARRVPRARGVKITFLQPKTDRTQVLYYLALDVSDAALGANPGFVPFLESYSPAYTFIKSASYLLHGPYFLKVRKAVLDASDFLVQDDTGFPYRMLVQGGWQISLFGNYAPPVKDFGKWGYQKDLESAFSATKPGALPFTFGYHWADGKSSMIVARRAAAATPAQKAAK
jgi:hypothetical protein